MTSSNKGLQQETKNNVFIQKSNIVGWSCQREQGAERDLARRLLKNAQTQGDRNPEE
jgi:hypothetical protein